MSLTDSRPVPQGRANQSQAASIWRLASKHVDPVVLLNDGDPALPLYCIHPVSGDVVGLRELAALLGTQRFYGIQVPGGKMNGEFGASIASMADHYVGLITARQPDGPIALAGWSAGAIIALDMAQKFRRAGRHILVLVALDGAPCNTGAGLSGWHPLYAFKLLRNLPRWIRDDRRQDWSWRGIVGRIESKLAFRFGVGASRISGGKGTLDAETMQHVAGIGGWSPDQKSFMHAMHQAMIDYVPASYAGRVIVYETQTQPLYHLRQIGAAWKAIAPATEVVPIKGNHSGLVTQPSVGVIADHLRLRLAEIRLAARLEAEVTRL